MTSRLLAARKFFRGEAGATKLEYGVMVAVVCLAGLTALSLLGTNIKDIFNQVGVRQQPQSAGASPKGGKQDHGNGKGRNPHE